MCLGEEGQRESDAWRRCSLRRGGRVDVFGGGGAEQVGRLEALLSPTRDPCGLDAAIDRRSRVRPAMPALAERVGRVQAFLAQVMNCFLKF
jgi:hypothetical protein